VEDEELELAEFLDLDLLLVLLMLLELLALWEIRPRDVARCREADFPLCFGAGPGVLLRTWLFVRLLLRAVLLAQDASRGAFLVCSSP